jgi:hypothetical protein
MRRTPIAIATLTLALRTLAQPAPEPPAVEPAAEPAESPEAAPAPEHPAVAEQPPGVIEPAPAPEPSPPPAAAPMSPPPALPGPTIQGGGPDVVGARAPGRRVAPPERTLGLEAKAGLGARLGGDSSGIGDEEPVDATFGAGLWLSPERLWSLGLAYQRLGLGGGRSLPSEGSVSVQREVDTAWLGGRAYPWRSDELGIYVTLALGLSWQQVAASGSRAKGTGNVLPPEPFACSASDGPGFALGGGVGLDVEMAESLAFLAQLDGTAHRLTSEPIGGCAPGSGSVTGVAAQIGFSYRFDLDDEPRRRTASRSR